MSRPLLLVLIAAASLGGIIGISTMIDRPDPAVAVRAALADLASRTEAAGTVRLETLIPADMLGIDLGTEVPLRLPLGLSGPFVAVDGELPYLYADLALSLEGGETIDDAPAIELVSDGSGTAALRPRNLTGVPAAGVQALEGRWLRVSAADAAMLLGSEDASAVAPADGRYDLATSARIRAVLADAGSFAVRKRLADEVIGGRTTRHFALLSDSDAVAGIAAAVFALAEGAMVDATHQERAAALLRDFDVAAEIWLDAEADVVRRIGFDLRPRVEVTAPPFRCIVDIETYDAPEDRVTVTDAAPLLDAVLGGLLPGAP